MPTWLSLCVPADSSEIDPLVSAALASGLPLDVTSRPGLWGGKMRGTDAELIFTGSSHYQLATDSQHAVDLVQANLIEVLSCLGREFLDYYFVPVSASTTESSLSGALQALAWAREEKHVKSVGMAVNEASPAAESAWINHADFEALLIPDSLQDLAYALTSKRPGRIVSRRGDIELLPVASACEVPDGAHS